MKLKELLKGLPEKLKGNPDTYHVPLWKYPIHLFKILFATVFGLIGACGWVVQMFIALLSVSFVVMVGAGTITYLKVKPEVDESLRKAYDTLQDMKRSDFSMLEDTEIYDINGDRIGIINAGHYEYVDISDISLNIQNAYIAQEDRRFKEHNGVDFIATFRAGLALIKHNGEISQGGSTITQQVIKNTYLTQEQTFERKIVEILLAPQVEREFSKADIMEFYCNTNFYGNRCYGVQAASLYYFGKDASELETWEAATLAGISNSPSAYNPVRHPDESKEKRNEVLKSMYEVGFITRAEYANAVSQPLSIVQETQEGTNENYQMSYAIHCATLELMKLEGFNFKYIYADKDDYNTYMDKYDETYGEISEKIRAGGYRIYTTLDPDIQAKAQDSLDSILSTFTQKQENGKYAIQGAAAVIDNTTGYVVAVIGGRGADDQFNRAYLSARQPGSSIKPLLDYAPAFDTGEYYPSKIMNDYKWADGPDNSGGGNRGLITIREAVNRSINTIAWQCLQGVGVDNALQYLGKMHFQKISWIDNGVDALALGGFTNGVRVVDMARGYATLANNGVFTDKTCITSIEFKEDGNLIKNLDEWTDQVYEEDTAFMMTSVLKGTINEAWGTGYGLGLSNGHIAAGKTGTTNSNKDAWFCGYTRYYSTAVWMGYDTPKAMPGVYGATYAGRIWQSIMNKLHADLTPLDWEQPGTVIYASYDPSTGKQSSTDTGLYDYFSSSASIRAEQTRYEKAQQALYEKLEPVVAEYEAFAFSSIEETYKVKEQWEEVMTKVSVIDDTDLRSLLTERINVKYKELQDEVKGMADTIKAYEDSLARQEQQRIEQEQLEAEEQLKQEEQELLETNFDDAMAVIKGMNYLENEEVIEGYLEDAREALALLISYDTYDSCYEELEDAIRAIDKLPTEEEWKKSEAERLEREAEEQRLKEEAESLAAQENDEALREMIDAYESKWSSKTETEAETTPSVSNQPTASSNERQNSITSGPGQSSSNVQQVGPGY